MRAIGLKAIQAWKTRSQAFENTSSAALEAAGEETDEYAIVQASFEEREALFLSMADHSNYIIGDIVSHYCSSDFKDSYVIIEAEGEEWRLEGLYWTTCFMETPFNIEHFQILSTDLWHVKVIVFYDGELSEKTAHIIKPKSIYYMPKFVGEDLEKRAQQIKKAAQKIVENYNAIENKEILSPDEAMRAVIKYEGLEDLHLEKTVFEDGIHGYSFGNYRLFYCMFDFNEYYNMSDEEYLQYCYEKTLNTRTCFITKCTPNRKLIIQ